MDIFQNLRFNTTESLNFLTEKFLKTQTTTTPVVLDEESEANKQTGNHHHNHHGFPSFLLEKLTENHHQKQSLIEEEENNNNNGSSRSTTPNSHSQVNERKPKRRAQNKQNPLLTHETMADHHQQQQSEESGTEDYLITGTNNSKRYRTSYTQHQTKVLEANFDRERYISRPQRALLAQELGLPENTIKVWFQNRRMKEKRQSMMLPNIAGNDPQLRETLIRVAQLYYSTRNPNGPNVDTEETEENNLHDSTILSTGPSSSSVSSGNSSSVLLENSLLQHTPPSSSQNGKQPNNNKSSSSSPQKRPTPITGKNNNRANERNNKFDFDPSLFLPLFAKQAGRQHQEQEESTTSRSLVAKRPFTVEGTLMTSSHQRDQDDV